MNKKEILIGLYVFISLMLCCVEYTGTSLLVMISYYTLTLLNLANSVRLANKMNNSKSKSHAKV